MNLRVFADANVFIYSFEYPESNSAKIIGLLNQGEIEVVTSEIVLKEVTKYLEKFHSIEHARKFRRYILDNCIVVMKSEVIKEINSLKGKIKDKDLEQLAVTKKYGIKFLIAYDKDFESFEEYATPRQFLDRINEEVADSEF